MKKNFWLYPSFLFIVLIAANCGINTKLYGPTDEQKIYTGRLSDSTFNALSKYLTKVVPAKLKDTIIIKYDYNYETCWSELDKREDKHIMGFVTRHKQRVQEVLLSRANVSVFDFREPGKVLNKVKKWNDSIIIDSTKQLFNLLFKDRTMCGSSIIIIPDQRFVFLRSDSHSMVLDLTQKQIEEMLSNKQNSL